MYSADLADMAFRIPEGHVCGNALYSHWIPGRNSGVMANDSESLVKRFQVDDAASGDHAAGSRGRGVEEGGVNFALTGD